MTIIYITSYCLCNFFVKNLIYVCSLQYKIDKTERGRRELDKMAFEREYEEKRKKLKNNNPPVATYVENDKLENLGFLKGLGKVVLIVGGFFVYFTIGVIAKLTSDYMKKK